MTFPYRLFCTATCRYFTCISSFYSLLDVFMYFSCSDGSHQCVCNAHCDVCYVYVVFVNVLETYHKFCDFSLVKKNRKKNMLLNSTCTQYATIHLFCRFGVVHVPEYSRYVHVHECHLCAVAWYVGHYLIVLVDQSLIQYN